MPSKAVLAERLNGEARLRRQQERFIDDRRREDRADRVRKDDELNGVRIQLRDQANTFATKDGMNALEHAFDVKVDTVTAAIDARITAALDRLNKEGTSGFRETEAGFEGRRDATKEILESQGLSRRWMVGIIVLVLLSFVADALVIVGLVLTHA